jgi:hypothetical protein
MKATARFNSQEKRMSKIKSPKPLISPSLAPPGNIKPPKPKK